MPQHRRGAVERALAALGALLLLGGIGAFARADPAGARALQLEVFLNGQTTKLVGAFRQEADGALSAERKELREVGIDPGGGAGDDLVSLEALPELTYSYDEPRQRIDVQLPLARRMPHAIDARGAVDEIGPSVSGTGLVLNYTLFASSVTGLGRLKDKPWLDFSGGSAQLDARVFTPLGVLNQTAILGTTTLHDVEALRLDTSIAYADPSTAIVYRGGDLVSGGPTWTRPIRMGGVQASRSFGLRPDIVTAPLPSVTGSAAVPSTVDVLVNNVRTFSREVPAGPYSITNLPTFSGNGTARVVLREATGREVETSLPFFVSPSLLREGLYDFSAQAGFPRLFYALKSNTYTTIPVATGSVRYGLTDALTIETHAEGGGGLMNGGVGLVSNIGGLGILSFAGRASRHGRDTGYQAYAGVETSLWGINFGAATQRSFGRFSDLASITNQFAPFDIDFGLKGGPGGRDPVDDGLVTGSIAASARPVQALDRISIGIPLYGWGSSVGLSLIDLRSGTGERSRIIGASYSQQIWQRASLSIHAFAGIGERGDYGVAASFSMPLGDFANATSGVVANGRGAYAMAEVSRGLGQEPGSYGYRARVAEGSGTSARTAAGAYRSGYGRIEGSVDAADGGARGTLEADGAIVLTGDGVHLGNRVDDAFAVVSVGAPDIEVLHQNRPVGRTGRSGTLLVPGLVANQKNRIAINPAGLPVSAHVAQTHETVVPADRAGVRVDFGVEASTPSAVVVLHDAEGKPLRAGLRGWLEGRKESFVVGYDGRAYVRELKATNRVRIETAPGECGAEFEFAPGAEDRQVVLGPLACL